MPVKYKVAQISFDFLADLLRKPTGLKIEKIMGIVQDPTEPTRGHLVYAEKEESK